MPLSLHLFDTCSLNQDAVGTDMYINSPPRRRGQPTIRSFSLSCARSSLFSPSPFPSFPSLSLPTSSWVDIVLTYGADPRVYMQVSYTVLYLGEIIMNIRQSREVK